MKNMTNPMFEENRQMFSSGIEEPMQISGLAKASAQSVAHESESRHKRAYRCIELSLEEVLADPIVQQVMQRDGVTASDILALMQQVQKEAKKSHASCMVIKE